MRRGRIGSRAIARLGRYEAFWRARSWLRRASFRVTRAIFGLRFRTGELRGHVSAIRVLAGQSAAPILLALVVVIGLEVVEGSWSSVVKDLGLAHTWTGRAVTHTIEGGSYSVLLQSVAAVSGVFLALYFTAVSTVAANVYSTTPHDVRDLMLRDKLGNAYVRVIAFLTALSVFLLVAATLGAEPSHVGLAIIAVLAGFSVFAFITLGQRAFYFADPTVLAQTATGQFARWFRSATPKGWRWLKPELQDHYRRHARNSLDALVGLIKIARDREHLHGEPERRLLSVAVVAVRFYVEASPQVPTASRWFGQRYEHKQWYLTDSSELDMATRMNAPLTPTIRPDSEWVEDFVLDPVLDSLRHALDRGAGSNAYTTLDQLSGLWEAFGGQLRSKQAAIWSAKITDLVLSATRSEHAEDMKTVAYRLGAMDLLALLPVAGELGLYRRILNLDVDALAAKLTGANLESPETPYDLDLPRQVVETIEALQRGIQFEDAADSPQRTPGWYVAQLALNRLGWAIHEEFLAWVDLIEHWYADVSDRLAQAGDDVGTAAVLSRALEAAAKLASHLDDFERQTTALRSKARLEDLQRPEWDWDALSERVEKLRREVHLRLAGSIPRLAKQAHDDNLPDFFGHAVHRSGEACIEALFAGDVQLFSQFFSPYFLGIFAMIDRLRPQVADWTDPTTAVTWMTEPLMDLLDVSGYAFVLAELHQDDGPRQAVVELWDRYIADQVGEARLRFINGASEAHARLFAISPRSVLRTQWEMRLSKTLMELPRRDGRRPFMEGEVDHPSPLIRRIAPTGSLGAMFLDAHDVFVARYLMPLPTADDMKFGASDSKLDELTDEALGGSDAA